MQKFLLIYLFVLMASQVLAQSTNNLPVVNELLTRQLQNIAADKNITADSAWNILSQWNNYPDLKNTGKYYLFIYKDSVFGNVPLKIYIPVNYKKETPSPAILILHGAVTLSSFKDAYKDTTSDEDLFYNFFSRQNFIIIRPFADSYGPNADGTINFDWVINRFNGRNSRNKTNQTYNSLVEIISQLKQVLNIDDNKLFAFGHSDGSDGAFSLEVYKPSAFAGFIVLNSMLKGLNTYDMYLRNTLNRPLYLLHSDLDDLRPIQQTRLIMSILDSLKSPVLYKEYLGYQHYDKHLPIDLPYSYKWMEQVSRNPFQKSVTWELSDLTNSGCDWLKVLALDTNAAKSGWQTSLNTKLYNKKTKVNMDFAYYDLNESAVAKAYYNNNTFYINTSRVTEVEILISPVMVNLQNPVIVKVNGKETFNKKVTADKLFLIQNFTSSFDRKALWVTAIKLKVN